MGRALVMLTMFEGISRDLRHPVGVVLFQVEHNKEVIIFMSYFPHIRVDHFNGDISLLRQNFFQNQLFNIKFTLDTYLILTVH